MGLLLSPDHTATLTDPTTWKDNPFVARDERRDIKKRQPFLSFCWMAGVLILVTAWTGSIVFSVQSRMSGVPFFIGGDIGTGLCVVISGVHIWFIIGAARKHSMRLFTEEANQNTLSSLLMLPISPFQILVQTMAYPWVVAMRMAFALLPVYVLCVGIDGPTWLELFALYLVFALAALSVPLWKRPALSENVAILAPPKPGRMGMTPKQQEIGQSSTGGAAASGSLAVRLFVIPVVIAFITLSQLSRLGAFQETISLYLPPPITSLFSSVLVSWPLLYARLLITPLDWFGLAIVPLPFVVGLVILGKYAQLVQASEFLSVGAYRDLPLQSTYLPRMRLVAGLRIAQALVVTGYLWKFVVVNGGLGASVPQAVGGNPGLSMFAFLLLCFATIWGLIRGAILGQCQLHPLIRGERWILCRNSLLDGARYLLEPYGFAIAFYLICCLLARTAPFPPLANSVAGNLGALFFQALLIGASGAVLSFGVSRLFGGAGIAIRIAVPVLILLGVFYSESIEIRTWLAGFPRVAQALSFVPHLRSLEILSPALGMLQSAALRAGGIRADLPGAPPWQTWVATHLILGAALWAVAHLLGARANAAHRDAVTLVFNPTILGREVFSDPTEQKRSAAGKTDTPFVTALIARLERVWDNAVMTRELRSRLRGKWDRTTLWVMLGLAAVLSLVFFHPSVAAVPTVLGGWLAFLLIGSMHNPIADTAAGILGCWYIVVFVWAFSNAFITTGAFYTESQKSTLGFLLSTPMSTPSIVLGKSAGIMASSFAVLASMAAWSLILTLLFLPLLGPAALLGWLYVVLTSLTLYLMVNSITFTISAMFPKLSMSGSAWVWVLLFWFGSFPLLSLFGMIAAALAAAGLQGASLWIAFIGIGWVLIVLSYVISVSSVHAMRRRDLTFAMTKRGN